MLRINMCDPLVGRISIAVAPGGATCRAQGFTFRKSGFMVKDPRFKVTAQGSHVELVRLPQPVVEVVDGVHADALSVAAYLTCAGTQFLQAGSHISVVIPLSTRDGFEGHERTRPVRECEREFTDTNPLSGKGVNLTNAQDK